MTRTEKSLQNSGSLHPYKVSIIVDMQCQAAKLHSCRNSTNLGMERTGYSSANGVLAIQDMTQRT